MVVTEFQYIFSTYFYREEFTNIRFRHIADLVDKGFRRVCREIDDNIEFIFDYTCLYRYRLEEVVSTEADTMKQIETELVAA